MPFHRPLVLGRQELAMVSRSLGSLSRPRRDIGGCPFLSECLQRSCEKSKPVSIDLLELAHEWSKRCLVHHTIGLNLDIVLDGVDVPIVNP
jgi:hypothetical protein